MEQTTQPRRASLVRYIIAALVASLLSSLVTFAVYAKYAEENLYTEAETLEIVKGVARAVSERAFHLGKQQKCERSI